MQRLSSTSVVRKQVARGLSSVTRMGPTAKLKRGQPSDSKLSFMVPAFFGEAHDATSRDPSLQSTLNAAASSPSSGATPTSKRNTSSLSSHITTSPSGNNLVCASSSLRQLRSNAISQHAKLTGSGIILLETDNYLNQPCLVLFRSSFRENWEEPGGFLKANEDPLQSAMAEVYEESYMTICSDQLTFFPFHIDVAGRSRSTMYRSYMATVSGLNPRVMQAFKQNVAALDASKRRHSHFFETDGIARIPMHSIKEDPHSDKYIASDCAGNPIVIGERTSKILREIGLAFLMASPSAFSASPSVLPQGFVEMHN